MKEQIVSTILSTECHASPFQHLRLNNFFPEEVHRSIHRFMPQIEACHELRHKDAIENGKSTRLQFGFSPQEWHKLPRDGRCFWVDALACLLDPIVTDSVTLALRSGMEKRYGERWSKVKLKPVPWLIRDQTGYRIGIHPDHMGKVITLQIYLPEDDSLRAAGTEFYKQEKPLSIQVESGKPAHENDQDKFRLVHKMEFLPNTGYAFVVQKDSWHGVSCVGQNKSCRDSLMIHYMQA